MLIRRFARILAVLFSAFVLTSAVMFWLPFLDRSMNGFYPEFIDSWSEPVQQLKDLSPAEERSLLDAISTELNKKSTAQLLQMKAFDDICANDLVDCRGLTASKVKPFIDAVLSERQTAETVLYYRAANVIAGGSLFISFIAHLRRPDLFQEELSTICAGVTGAPSAMSRILPRMSR